MASSTTTVTKTDIHPPSSPPPQLPSSQQTDTSRTHEGHESIELSPKSPGASLRELFRRLKRRQKNDAEPGDPSSATHPATAEKDGKDFSTVATSPSSTSSPPPAPSSPVPQQSWNHPRSNIARLLFAFFSFIIAGLNDAAIGALLPSLEVHYNLTYTTVSLIFLTPFAGYALAAFLNATIHARYGQRGIAFLAPLCHVITYVVIALHPPFPVIVVINVISGFGNGLTDACFCAWVGVMKDANAVQGCMHACYSVGALCAPLIVTGLVVTGGYDWWYFYYVMVGVSVVEWVGLTASFWRRTGAVYRREHRREGAQEEDGEGDGEGEKQNGTTREALKSRITWTCAAFFFFYMGIEVGLGGWVITFMLRVRNATPYDAGISGTGFWAGMTVGRAGLGFITNRYGERLCVSIYLCFALALQLVFWLVPNFVVSAVAVALLGVFLGPMFPGCVMMASRLLPSRMHVSALGFAMAIGGTGGTVFPFAIGAIAAKAGVRVLQPIVVALIVVVAGLWLSFPRVKKTE